MALRNAISLEEEFQKNPEFPKHDLPLLKEWLNTQDQLPSISDEKLVLFHHSCSYELEKTKSCINTFYTIRSNTPEFFNNRDLACKALQAAAVNVTCFVLPKKTAEGYLILYQKVESSEVSKYNFDESCKLFFMTMDVLLQIEGTAPGIIFLLDYTNIRFGHLAKASITSIRKMFQYVQEGAPIKLKSIHMVNMNYFIDKTMTFVKPFMNKELNEMINYYQEGCIAQLYGCIPKECLPSDYGGYLPSCSDLKSQHMNNWRHFEEFFMTDERFFHCKESQQETTKRPKRSESLRIAFKKLDID